MSINSFISGWFQTSDFSFHLPLLLHDLIVDIGIPVLGINVRSAFPTRHSRRYPRVSVKYVVALAKVHMVDTVFS